MSQIDFYIGLGGLIFLAVPWIWQTVVVLKTKKATIPVSFNSLYATGGALLSVYSFLIGDLIFFIMNVLATLASLIHLIISIRYR